MSTIPHKQWLRATWLFNYSGHKSSVDDLYLDATRILDTVVFKLAVLQFTW